MYLLQDKNRYSLFQGLPGRKEDPVGSDQFGNLVGHVDQPENHVECRPECRDILGTDAQEQNPVTLQLAHCHGTRVYLVGELGQEGPVDNRCTIRCDTENRFMGYYGHKRSGTVEGRKEKNVGGE